MLYVGLLFISQIVALLLPLMLFGTALPRAPAHLIREGLREINNLAKGNRDLDQDRILYRQLWPLISYVERQWTERIRPEQLSVHGLWHTTNNTSEVNHNTMMYLSTVRHPNAWDFVGEYA